MSRHDAVDQRHDTVGRPASFADATPEPSLRVIDGRKISAPASAETPAADMIELDLIRLDGGTQPRATRHQETIDRYIEDMAAGATFPPLVVFYDGAHHWLADGFHRHDAAKSLGLATFPADVRQGTQRDAILYSVGSNAAHGLQRTQADKRRAIMTLLNDSVWSGWTDREIARRCLVDNKTVASLRPKPPVTEEFLGQKSKGAKRTYKTRHGTTATMDTENIGKRPAPASVEAEEITADGALDPTVDEPTEPRPLPTMADVDPAITLGGPISDRLLAIEEDAAKLPSPGDAVEFWPASLAHTVDPRRMRVLANWLNTFADLWEAAHVAA